MSKRQQDPACLRGLVFASDLHGSRHSKSFSVVQQRRLYVSVWQTENCVYSYSLSMITTTQSGVALVRYPFFTECDRATGTSTEE